MKPMSKSKPQEPEPKGTPKSAYWAQLAEKGKTQKQLTARLDQLKTDLSRYTQKEVYTPLDSSAFRPAFEQELTSSLLS